MPPHAASTETPPPFRKADSFSDITGAVVKGALVPACREACAQQHMRRKPRRASGAAVVRAAGALRHRVHNAQEITAGYVAVERASLHVGA